MRNDVAEDLMPKSPLDDAHKCLSNLIEALEEAAEAEEVRQSGTKEEELVQQNESFKENGEVLGDKPMRVKTKSNHPP
ncbi:hypothetical protein Fmac_005630 [Flemingia macrophylla]|uniref:AAA+ ATPase At3g28540-like C-terminal domain-containing protein n=1 Tax=Flemingia macrophylla TaxID=520843 RepID=A0ABD1NB24_9FABA